MQWLNGVYAQRFNKRHDRFGHLFAGRYGARTIETDEHFARACEYVPSESGPRGTVRACPRLAVERLQKRVSGHVSEHLFDPIRPDTLGRLWPLKSSSFTAPASTT